MAETLYRCELCRMFITSNKKIIEKHEKMPIKEGSIDGLIIKNMGTYEVYKKLNNVNDTHSRLYNRDRFNLPPDKYWHVDKSPYRGSSEKELIKHLKDGRKFIKELSEEEFIKITKIIKKYNPIYYKNIEFKREISAYLLK